MDRINEEKENLIQKTCSESKEVFAKAEALYGTLDKMLKKIDKHANIVFPKKKFWPKSYEYQSKKLTSAHASSHKSDLLFFHTNDFCNSARGEGDYKSEDLKRFSKELSMLLIKENSNLFSSEDISSLLALQNKVIIINDPSNKNLKREDLSKLLNKNYGEKFKKFLSENSSIIEYIINFEHPKSSNSYSVQKSSLKK